MAHNAEQALIYQSFKFLKWFHSNKKQENYLNSIFHNFVNSSAQMLIQVTRTQNLVVEKKKDKMNTQKKIISPSEIERVTVFLQDQ